MDVLNQERIFLGILSKTDQSHDSTLRADKYLSVHAGVYAIILIIQGVPVKLLFRDFLRIPSLLRVQGAFEVVFVVCIVNDINKFTLNC